VSASDAAALLVSLRLALVTVVLLLIVGAPLAWWLGRSRSRLRPLVETLVALPLVLPPTVLGFYLLLLFGASGPLGKLALFTRGQALAFSFEGLVLGSVVYSLPFVVQPLAAAFSALDGRLLEVAATLGRGPLGRLRSVVLPLTLGGWLRATALGFAHTLGEFGVVMMLGGNIPGETRVASVAIYEHVEALDYASAHRLALTLVALSVAVLFLVQLLGRRERGGDR
jgi:molybdate transport system permease protein